MQGFVAIYGGSFDPLHKGHSEIIKALCENPRYWHIILMPNYANPLKTPPLFSPMQRLQMCESIAKVYNEQYPPLSSLPRVSVSDYEVLQNRPVFSIESISHIKLNMRAHFPQAQYVFVLGSDALAHLGKWHKPQEICQMVQFVVIKREGETYTPHASQSKHTDVHLPLAPQVIEQIKLEHFGALSSSAVRLLLQNGDMQSAFEKIPPSIHSIIQAHFRL